MKKFILLLLMPFIFTNCSTNTPTVSCCTITNFYRTYDCTNCTVSKKLNSARGYERIAKIIFVDNLVNNFSKKVKKYLDNVYYSQQVNNPYIDNHCRKLDSIVRNRENNDSTRSEKIYQLQSVWVNDYEKKLNEDLKGKLKFNKLDGCEKEANKFEELLFDRKGAKEKSKSHYLNIKRIYTDCLFLANKRKTQIEVEKLKQELEGKKK